MADDQDAGCRAEFETGSVSPPLDQTVTSTFLRRRFWVSGLVLLAPLVVAAVLSVLSILENVRNNSFAAAFGRVSGAISQLESSLSSMAHMSDLPISASGEYSAAGRRSFVDLLSFYNALRIADREGTSALGDAGRFSGLREFLAALTEDFGVDPTAVNVEMGLAGATMPAPLAKLWGGWVMGQRPDLWTRAYESTT
jgi:hypothetical protein